MRILNLYAGVGGKKWEEWFKQHSEMPYVYQMPVDEKVKEHINKKYKFKLK